MADIQQALINAKRNQSHDASAFCFPTEFDRNKTLGVEARELEKIFSPAFGESLIKEGYRFFVAFFEKLLNLKFLVEPQVFGNVEPKLHSIFKKIILLKQKGFVEDFSWDISRFNDEPKFLRFNVAPKKKFCPTGGSSGVGKSLGNKEKAMAAALGEAIERISLHIFNPKDSLIASFSKLGRQAVNPEFFRGSSQEAREKIQNSETFQKYHPGLKLTFDNRTQFKWTKVHSFFGKGNAYIPLQQISVIPAFLYKSKEPLLRFPISTGAAAGRSLNDALVKGILELVERETFMITWLNQIKPEIVDLESIPDEGIQKIIESFLRYNLEFYMMVMSTDFKVPVFWGLVIDRSGIGPAVTVCTKAGFDFVESIKDVAADILSVRAWLRSVVAKSGIPDLEHLSIEKRSFYWYGVDKITDIETFTRGEKKSLDYFRNKYSAAFTTNTIKKRLNFLLERIKTLKFDAYWVDITAKELKQFDIPVVKVIIPQMQPLYVDECFPYWEGERLKLVPKKLGLSLNNNIPDLPPHPFA